MHVKGTKGVSKVSIVQPFQAMIAMIGKNFHFYGQAKSILFMIYFLQTDLKNPIGSIKIPKSSDYIDQNSWIIGKTNRFFCAFKNTWSRIDFSSEKTR